METSSLYRPSTKTRCTQKRITASSAGRMRQLLPALTLRGTSSPVFATGGKVLAGFSNGTLVAVEASDGVWSWEERVAVPEGQYDIDRVIDIDGQLLVDGSRVLASSYQGNLMALDVNTGRIVWGREASSFHGIERGFGNLYYVDDEGVITAVRDNSEDVVWENSDLNFEASRRRARWATTLQ